MLRFAVPAALAILLGLLLFLILPDWREPIQETSKAALSEQSDGRNVEALESEVDSNLLSLENALPSEGSRSFQAIQVEIKELVALDAPSAHSHEMGSWLGRMDPHPSTWEWEGNSKRVAMGMPDGSSLVLTIDEAELNARGNGVFAGTIDGSASSRVILSRLNGAIAGVFRIPAQGISWEIRNGPGTFSAFDKIDLAKLGECAACAP